MGRVARNVSISTATTHGNENTERTIEGDRQCKAGLSGVMIMIGDEFSCKAASASAGTVQGADKKATVIPNVNRAIRNGARASKANTNSTQGGDQNRDT